MLTGLRWHVEESLWKEHRTWANMKHIRQTLKRGQAPLRNRWPAALGGVIIGLQGRSLLDLAGSCDSRRAWLQDGLFPAWCTSQRHIREAKPDGLWTPVVCVCVCVSPGNKIKTAPRDLSTLLLISMWTMQWNPCTQHWLSPRELLKMQLSTMEASSLVGVSTQN